MRNYRTIMENAKYLTGENRAFLCGQYDMSQTEIMLSGDPECVIRILRGSITRLSEITNCSYREILGLLKDLGSGNTHVLKEGEVATIAEPQKSNDEKYLAIIRDYENENSSLLLKLTAANATIEALKDLQKKQLDAKDKTIKALNKELKDIEHRIDEIVETRLALNVKS